MLPAEQAHAHMKEAGGLNAPTIVLRYRLAYLDERGLEDSDQACAYYLELTRRAAIQNRRDARRTRLPVRPAWNRWSHRSGLQAPNYLIPTRPLPLP